MSFHPGLLEGRLAMKLLSVSVSMGKEVSFMGKTVATGIFKEPVSGSTMLRTLNLDGDRQVASPRPRGDL